MNTIEKKEVEVVEDFEFRFGKISEPVLGLIDIVKSEKAKALEHRNNYFYLNHKKPFQIDYLNKVIAETTDKINAVAYENGFSRDIIETQTVDDFFKFSLTVGEFDKYTGYWFDDTDLFVFKEKYLSYGEDVDKEIKLPKFQLITDYLALLEYYDILNCRLTELEKGNDELKSDEKLIKKVDIEQPKQLQEPDESIKEEIMKEFDNSDIEKYFMNKSDFLVFVEALSLHLSDEEYILPQPIKLIRGGITKIAKAVYTVSYGRPNLSDDIKLFNLMRVLSSFKEKTNKKIYYDMQRTK